MIIRVGAPLAILAIALLGAGYLRATRPQMQSEPFRERVWTVAVATAKSGDERPEIRVHGEIVAGREVALRPWVGGRVVEVGAGFVDGGTFAVGNLVVAIDTFDYQAAIDEKEAQLLEARGKLAEIDADLVAEAKLLERDQELVALAKRNFERQEKLHRTSVGSEKSFDDARMALSEHEQGVIARRQAIERLRARGQQQRAVVARYGVAVRRAKRNLSLTRLTAPFDGFVVNTDTETAVGKSVGVGDEIARLIDADRLEVRFHLSNFDFARLLEAGGYRGKPARVVWRVGPEEFIYDAVIERIDSEIDARSGGVDFFARIENTDPGANLRPGAFVQVNVPDRVYEDVVRLPESALFEGGTVYAVADGVLEPRRVEFVVRDGGDILLRGDLKAGAEIVTTRFPEIGPGIRVKVQ